LKFRLKTDESFQFARIVDVDTSHVISNKIHLIDRSEELKKHLEEVKELNEKSLHSKNYHLVSHSFIQIINQIIDSNLIKFV
jgi:rRNA maturation endonuclease Nob1